MIPFAEAVACVRAAARVLPSELVALGDARDRVLAEDVVSAVDVPRFASSAMDGFAIESASGGNVRTVRRKIVAGDDPLDAPVQAGEAVAIMTGAPLPDGADAIVKIEDTTRDGDHITFSSASSAFIRAAATDFTRGAVVAAKGRVLTPELLMAIAAVGVGRLAVVRRPRVLVVPTGKELRDPGEPLRGRGEIWCSSSVYLQAALSDRADVTVAEIVRDDPAVFKTTLTDADIIITTGAVSMGEHDFIPQALRELGAEILFHKMATKPAKPTLFARRGGQAIFGLAGNPISTAVGCRFLVQAYLARCLGLPDEIPLRLPVAKPLTPPPGLTGIYKCQNLGDRAHVLGGQESHLIRSLTEANAWAVTTADPASVEVYGIGMPR